MQGWATERILEGAAEVMPQIAGVEHRVLGYLADRDAVSADVGIGADQNPEVAVEGPDFPDRLRTVVLETKSFIGPLHRRDRQEGHQVGLDANRSGARAPTAVRGRKGLVQVEMDHVETHVAWPRNPHQRVEVGAVVVDLDPLLMRKPRDFQNVLFE